MIHGPYNIKLIIRLLVILHLNFLRAAAEKIIANYFKQRVTHISLIFHFNIQIFARPEQLHIFIYSEHIIIFIQQNTFFFCSQIQARKIF